MTTQTAPASNGADSASAPSRFIQCRTPTVLYEWIRPRGFLTNSIVLEAMAAYRTELDASRGAPGQAMPDDGPQVTYNVRLDNDTYDWLRATAVHAGASINALVVAALANAHAHADHAAGAAATDA